MDLFLHLHPIFSPLSNLNFLTWGTQKFKLPKILPGTLSPTQIEPKEPERSKIDPCLDYETGVHILLVDAACGCFGFDCYNFGHFSSALQWCNLLKLPENVLNKTQFEMKVEFKRARTAFHFCEQRRFCLGTFQTTNSQKKTYPESLWEGIQRKFKYIDFHTSPGVSFCVTQTQSEDALSTKSRTVKCLLKGGKDCLLKVCVSRMGMRVRMMQPQASQKHLLFLKAPFRTF